MGLVKSQWGLPEMSMGSNFNGAVTGGSYSFIPFETSHEKPKPKFHNIEQILLQN